jgi:hypothetical protein
MAWAGMECIWGERFVLVRAQCSRAGYFAVMAAGGKSFLGLLRKGSLGVTDVGGRTPTTMTTGVGWGGVSGEVCKAH